VTVRRAIPLAAALAALAALAGCGAAGDPAPVGSTLQVTLRDPDGDGVLQRAPGEPLSARTELAPARAAGRVLATFGQLTDTHVRDTGSPARVAFLDRLGPPFTSTFRPQEALTTQVLAAGVKAVDAVHPDLTVVTGDLIDNDQANELDWALRVLRGGRVRPPASHPDQVASNPDPAFYRPDVDPPRHPGLLAAASRPFTSPGLRGRTAVIPGNHDLLVAGEVRATPQTEAVAVGSRRLVEPAPGLAIPRQEALAATTVQRLLRDGRLPGRTAAVRPDPARHELSAAEDLARLRAAGMAPPGGDRVDAVYDVGTRVRAVVLDVTRRTGLDQGAVAPGQAAFLARALREAGDRWVVVFSHEPLRKVAGGAALTAQLDADPHVLAAVAGDTHRSRIAPHRTPRGGWWDITTSALADFPQQARALRVRETAGGGAVLDTWMLDTAPSPLADTARDLAFLDAQGGRPGGNAGTRADRNVRLYVPAPR
jgi:3',5'-cyclic AMP phosphodiesterase CpdA